LCPPFTVEFTDTGVFCGALQFNIEDLQGKTIDLSSHSAKPISIESGSRKKYVLMRDATTVHSNIRPIVHNGVDGSTGVGGAFSGSFAISEKIDLKVVSPTTPLPVICWAREFHRLL
jgi:hypothetical protein